MGWPLIAAIIALLALNAFASLGVLRSGNLPLQRRFVQLALVWLVPVVGAVLCLSFLATDTISDEQSLDRTAFVDNADAGGLPYDAAPGSSLCGCSVSDTSGGDGASD
ncbi:hypothetical protein [Xanthomonas arboricola]